MSKQRNTTSRALRTPRTLMLDCGAKLTYKPSPDPATPYQICYFDVENSWGGFSTFEDGQAGGDFDNGSFDNCRIRVSVHILPQLYEFLGRILGKRPAKKRKTRKKK